MYSKITIALLLVIIAVMSFPVYKMWIVQDAIDRVLPAMIVARDAHLELSPDDGWPEIYDEVIWVLKRKGG